MTGPARAPPTPCRVFSLVADRGLERVALGVHDLGPVIGPRQLQSRRANRSPS